jgi:hypothetical protein
MQECAPVRSSLCGGAISETEAPLVDDRYHKGQQDAPRNHKPGTVALSATVQRDLAAWRAFVIADDALIFPTKNLESRSSTRISAAGDQAAL